MSTFMIGSKSKTTMGWQNATPLRKVYRKSTLQVQSPCRHSPNQIQLNASVGRLFVEGEVVDYLIAMILTQHLHTTILRDNYSMNILLYARNRTYPMPALPCPIRMMNLNLVKDFLFHAYYVTNKGYLSK